MYEEYLDLCAPCYEEAGAYLLHALVDPMMWLHHDYNNLIFMWQIDGGPRGMWDAGRHWTPEVAAWRASLKEHCKSFTWYKLATPEGIEELDRVSYDILD